MMGPRNGVEPVRNSARQADITTRNATKYHRTLPGTTLPADELGRSGSSAGKDLWRSPSTSIFHFGHDFAAHKDSSLLRREYLPGVGLSWLSGTERRTGWSPFPI